MDKEHRITRFGDMLNRIDEALAQKDLTELPADKLLDMKLKYEERLEREYIAPETALGEDNTEGQLWEIESLMLQAGKGQIDPAQIKARLALIEARGRTIDTLKDEQNPLNFSWA